MAAPPDPEHLEDRRARAAAVLEDAAFLTMLVAGVALVVAIVVLALVL
jgi:hypothetical protein